MGVIGAYFNIYPGILREEVEKLRNALGKIAGPQAANAQSTSWIR
jgi:hypothetical protein